jgi:hypothetical protein
MRLGVFWPTILLNLSREFANSMTSVRNWAPTPTRKRCPHG